MQKIKQIFASDGLQQSIKMLFGNTFATGISAIALIIYSRLLGPEKFGEFSTGFAIVMILTRINDSGFNNALLKYTSEIKEEKIKNHVFNITLKYKLLINIVIIFFGLISFRFIANIFNIHDPIIVLLAFIFGTATVYYEQLLNTLQAIKNYNASIIVNLMQATTKIIWAMIILFSNYSNSLITFSWYVLAPIIPVLFWRKLLPSNFIFKIDLANSDLQKKITSMAKHSAVGIISAGIIENIDILYLQKYLNTYEVGLYSGVSRISLIFALAAYSLGNVLYPRVANYKSKSDRLSYLKKSFLVILACLVGFALFIPFGEMAILLTIGVDYISGINILYILTAASFIAVAAIPFIALFFSYDANWYFSASGILQLVVVMLGNVFFVPIYGLEAAAYTRLLSRFVLFFFTFVLALYIFKKNHANEE